MSYVTGGWGGGRGGEEGSCVSKREDCPPTFSDVASSLLISIPVSVKEKMAISVCVCACVYILFSISSNSSTSRSVKEATSLRMMS